MSDSTIVQQQIDDHSLNIKTSEVLDNSNAHEMIEVLTEAHQRGIENVTIDMSDLCFISSAGVGSILGTVELFRETGGDIHLCNLRPPVTHVLEVLDLTDYLTVQSEVKEAVD
ncbi:MAG: STAS domain-containing protein [bacterium]|nr:STAS domain-containing protein [bacterium]